VDDGLARLLRRQDGCITRRQALRHLSEKALRHRVASGRWRRVLTGVYVTHAGAPTAAQYDWLAVLASGGDDDGDVCLGGLSALRAGGLRGVEPAALDVLIPYSRAVSRPCGIRVHRSRIPPRLAIARPGFAPCCAPDRAVVDAAQWARSDREARLIIAASFQQSLVTLAAVGRALREQPKARRRALVKATAEDCAGGSHSVAELDFVALCREYYLPLPTRQVVRRDGRGRRRYVDVLFDEWMVAVEIDGSHHLDVHQQWDDAVKANALELAGYTVLRYPAYAIRTEGRRIAEEIRQALRQRGWPTDLAAGFVKDYRPQGGRHPSQMADQDP
jgi:uncharacterized protein DUF559/putative AbiEi antitoxin of type IV toxin-antitoxin system